jgi:hypothetical protein
MKQLFIVSLALAAALLAPGLQAEPVIEVYKRSTCICCAKWMSYLRSNGFTVRGHDVRQVRPFREQAGVPRGLGACHTATVEGYVIEGHVPAEDIKRLLAERPQARGLAVPGMPEGSPGMEGPHSEPYEVLLILPDGTHRTYATHGR